MLRSRQKAPPQHRPVRPLRLHMAARIRAAWTGVPCMARAAVTVTTLSLKLALEPVGFGPCYHMIEVLKNQHFAAYWKRAAYDEHMDWDQVFDGYRATIDWQAVPAGGNCRSPMPRPRQS